MPFSLFCLSSAACFSGTSSIVHIVLLWYCLLLLPACLTQKNHIQDEQKTLRQCRIAFSKAFKDIEMAKSFDASSASEHLEDGELPSLALERPFIKRPQSSITTIYSGRTVEASAPDDETAYSCRQNSRDPLVENFAYNCSPFRETYTSSSEYRGIENGNKAWFSDLGYVLCSKSFSQQDQSSSSSLCSFCGIFS